MLGYKLNMSHKGQYPPWGIRLEAKMKETQTDVGKLSKLEKYSKLSVTEALEAAKQRLIAPAARLKRYTRDMEARRINRMFTTEPSKMYSQWKGKKLVMPETLPWMSAIVMFTGSCSGKWP